MTFAIRVLLALFVLGAVASWIAIPAAILYGAGETIDQRSE